MSFLKYIMSPFIEFKEGINPQIATNKGSASIPTKAIIPSTNTRHTAEATVTTNSNTNGTSDHQKHFDELIEEANSKNSFFQGTDFKEFIDSKIDVEAIADESTRYRTAFNVLKRTGLTKDKLITTGREYIKIIDNDLKAFEGFYSQQYQNDVKRQEELLQSKEEELKQLNAKIENLKNEVSQLSQQINNNKNQLVSNNNSFVLAGENKKKEIENELKKINEYFS